MSRPREWPQLADELGLAAVADGEPTRWYDELWSAAGRGEVGLPWDRTEPHPVLAEWLPAHAAGERRRAVVVGCGLGGDSEFLAGQAWETTAFDISPSAVDAVRDRYPGSAVDYRVADLLELGAGRGSDLVGAFDLVVEIYTLQALHHSLRERAVAGLHALLAPGGTALVVQQVRRDDQPRTPEPPWRLTRAEVGATASDDVRLVSLDEVHPPGRDGPLWRAVLTRPE